MKFMKLPEFIQLPAGTIYQKLNEPYLLIKGDWVSENNNDWTCCEFVCTKNADTYWLEMSYGESLPILVDYFGRAGYFEADTEFLVFEKYDLEQMRLAVDKALAIAPEQKFKMP